MAAAAVVLHWMNRAVDTRGLNTELWTATVLQTLTWAAAGALIVTKRPNNPFGWLFCGASLAAAVTTLGNEYAVHALLVQNSRVPGGEWVLWLANWSWVLYLGIIPAVLLLFPDGKLLSRRWAPALALAVVATSALLVTQILRPGTMVESGSLATVNNLVGIQRSQAALDSVGLAARTLLDVAIAVGVLSLLLRFRRARGDERLQLKWLASVAVFLPVTLLLTYVAPGVPSTLAFKLHVALLIGTITVAVLKYRLYDIDVILNRSLVYATLTVLVLGIYVAVVAAAGAVLQAQAGLVPSLIATGVVAAAFSPLRDRLQSGVNRLLYGGRDEPYEVLSRLGQRLESTLAVDEVLPGLVETVAQTFKLPYAAVAVPGPGSPGDDAEFGAMKTVASYGQEAPVVLRLPLQYQGAPVGVLELAARSGDEGFTPADRRLLTDIARQAGVATHAVALTAALQASRERLVAAREEERRRLRRDLHDGLGPTLTAVALQIDATRNMLRSDPAAADELLKELRAEVKSSIDGIRRLVYDLRPPALDELGLVRALREQAAGFVRAGNGRLDGLHVTVEAPGGLPSLPAAVEVAAYRIGAEAVTNVARHAKASHCELRLTVNGALEVQVTDDGIGAGASWRPGVGLASMRERAAELGGTLSVEPSASNGTRVLAKLPLRTR
ncbi:GAF domain-containing sensor histidine kinase [Mycobacterium hackensackense]|uniref:GAF domain-containing sensor histidine kinase n=1 Tax=Mycobacterium hackensackense TaxID=228909 RepID=UPI002265A7E7|nr:GAF domain-containing sensor histidine kinase [Mycobacterium hackensackense]MCV7255384.1 GAF domain-containing sensor histidine kinase [Mycobacterium hackensackense]